MQDFARMEAELGPNSLNRVAPTLETWALANEPKRVQIPAQVSEIGFPRWVPPDIRHVAERFSEEEARVQLGEWINAHLRRKHTRGLSLGGNQIVSALRLPTNRFFTEKTEPRGGF